MVQRSEMGTISITPDSIKEHELKTRMDEAGLKVEVNQRDRETMTPTSITMPHNSSIPHAAKNGKRDGATIDSELAAEDRFETLRREQNSRVSGTSQKDNSKEADLREQFKNRANSVSWAQNLGRTPWSNYSALNQLEQDTGEKVPPKRASNDKSKKTENDGLSILDNLLGNEGHEKPIRPLGPVTNIRTGQPLGPNPQSKD
jgi:hypothetical protein